MKTGLSIRMGLATVLGLAVAACSTPPLQAPVPLSQDALDSFLESGRDPRYSGVTVYQHPSGAHYEFANRVHQDRTARMNFVSPAWLPWPLLEAKTPRFTPFHLLLDSSARQSWLLCASIEPMDYRPFAPPTGEYPDHVRSEIPGYAGLGNKIVLDKLHIESPVFYVPPATGHLGPLARVDTAFRAETSLSDRRWKELEALPASVHAVMGAAMMRNFSFIRIDFPARNVFFATHKPYKPPVPSAVVASLPLRDWRGRPAVEGLLNGEPVVLVLDTAGDFAVSLPGAPPALTGRLSLGELDLGEVPLAAHAALGLPSDFAARLGTRTLADFAVTLDYKQNRVWLEDPALYVPPTDDSAAADSDAPKAPTQYRGITR